ncbi:Uncharacterized protein C9orf171 [Trichoplax sp. H2]|nr:Uncharacterized protein C9orf171 [Trichoplax sp. H2]|eukprot:RDD44436.1 Uncharacterized protein C9orf171 [Trichoplax sp. H2]
MTAVVSGTFVGTYRESYETNPLLKKSELGRPLNRGFTLPGDDFVYGVANHDKGGGAAQAIMHWNKDLNHKTKLPALKKKEQQPKDFITMNKAATQSGITTSKEQAEFREVNEIRLKKSYERRAKQAHRIPVEAVFGHPTRPSTPVFDLLEHKYQEKWIQEKRQHELHTREKKQQKMLNGKIYETKASLLRKFEPPVQQTSFWHMPKWEKVPAHLETFRSVKAREASFQKLYQDGTARKGIFHHGVYELPNGC